MADSADLGLNDLERKMASLVLEPRLLFALVRFQAIARGVMTRRMLLEGRHPRVSREMIWKVRQRVLDGGAGPELYPTTKKKAARRKKGSNHHHIDPAPETLPHSQKPQKTKGKGAGGSKESVATAVMPQPTVQTLHPQLMGRPSPYKPPIPVTLQSPVMTAAGLVSHPVGRASGPAIKAPLVTHESDMSASSFSTADGRLQRRMAEREAWLAHYKSKYSSGSSFVPQPSVEPISYPPPLPQTKNPPQSHDATKFENFKFRDVDDAKRTWIQRRLPAYAQEKKEILQALDSGSSDVTRKEYLDWFKTLEKETSGKIEELRKEREQFLREKYERRAMPGPSTTITSDPGGGVDLRWRERIEVKVQDAIRSAEMKGEARAVRALMEVERQMRDELEDLKEMKKHLIEHAAKLNPNEELRQRISDWWLKSKGELDAELSALKKATSPPPPEQPSSETGTASRSVWRALGFYPLPEKPTPHRQRRPNEDDDDDLESGYEEDADLYNQPEQLLVTSEKASAWERASKAQLARSMVENTLPPDSPVPIPRQTKHTDPPIMSALDPVFDVSEETPAQEIPVKVAATSNITAPEATQPQTTEAQAAILAEHLGGHNSVPTHPADISASVYPAPYTPASTVKPSSSRASTPPANLIEGWVSNERSGPPIVVAAGGHQIKFPSIPPGRSSSVTGVVAYKHE